MECELFFFHLRNILTNNSKILKDIGQINDFKEFKPSEELDLYSPKIFKEYDPWDVIYFCVFFRPKKEREILANKYYQLESAITAYILSADFIIESTDEYDDILDKRFPIIKEINNQKIKFVKDYNDSIVDLKEQHNVIIRLLNEIESYPLRGYKLYPFT